MGRAFNAKVVTANALLQGDVIYLCANDSWSRDHAQAELIEDEAHAQIRLLFAAAQGDVVGAMLADARSGASGPEPVHFREAFRAKGPSNYLHGKQEADENV
ncbi:MAG: DUF2849 domain-containing protein [Marinosulfonomonas sp.]|nr:DUF2849 domain-containing protein [Marinosulfonomonas sp.]